MQSSENENILDYTESLCPICLKVIEAMVIAQDQKVYLKKICPHHGPSAVYQWPNKNHFRWMNAFRMSYKHRKPQITWPNDCPLDCGLCPSHLRRPTVVEIEVTHHCNLRCPICFMAADSASVDPVVQTIEDMYQTILVQSGPQISIQLTGGEPTVREDLPEIVRLGRRAGFFAIEVNTNGLLIGCDPMYARQLVEAGVTGIYLQFDGLTGRVYEQIRGADLLKDKLQAIEHCRTAGLQVVLAMTVLWNINHTQIGAVLDFALRNRDVIKGVAYQPAFTSGRFDARFERRLTMGDVIFMLAEQSHGLIDPYDMWPLECSHPLCSCATLILNHKGVDKPFTRLITPQEYVDLFDSNSPQGSVFSDIAAKLFPDAGNGLSLVVMNYMDALSMDLKRLRECSMTVKTADGRMIPFCAYHVTNVNGERIYAYGG